MRYHLWDLKVYSFQKKLSVKYNYSNFLAHHTESSLRVHFVAKWYIFLINEKSTLTCWKKYLWKSQNFYLKVLERHLSLCNFSSVTVCSCLFYFEKENLLSLHIFVLETPKIDTGTAARYKSNKLVCWISL